MDEESKCPISGNLHDWIILQVKPVKVKVCGLCGKYVEEDKPNEKIQ
jgi:hypothetical protein